MKWSIEEINYLKDNYGKINIRNIIKDLNRTKYSIEKKAERLKLYYDSRLNSWADNEKNLLKTLYGNIRTREICKYINRSYNAIKREAFLLGLKSSFGNKGLKYSDSTKSKMSEARTLWYLNNPKKAKEKANKTGISNLGNTWEKLYGKDRTRELKDKMSIRLKLNNPTKNGHSIETKNLIRDIANFRYKTNPLVIEKIKLARSKQVLPIKDTKIEIKIQDFLKYLKIDFFIHHYITDIEHKYQCDIFIPNLNMVIECDGNYFHKYPIGKDIDHIRTKELLEKGFKVLRLWESDINSMNLDRFKQTINFND